ncbi:signal-regulatory protein beta-1-like isoform X1 [Alligator sinensis]|uniref:Signal-regulatory protein beta-1-like isoform X1 n=1 Tax=Alligator sinensis TaxID=38654 RepID=A0A1U8D2I7_ALLSI|nr:signal-regulatory protein beta-1-like isoform X1 [Alligator sinensis]XP_025057502.1 signal-regulatory protein beta-1-like isoform X1 [Alligator sinensis]
MQLFSLTLGLALLGSSGGGGQDFQVLQPWPSAQASAGETLMLNCTVTKRGLPGPVKWLKGSGSNHQLIYAEIGSFPRVTRAVPSSVSDYSIHISDIRPEDAGTYYCVKFKKEPPDEEYQRGTGTVVSVGGLSTSAASAVGGAACVLVLLLLIAIYFYLRKRRGLSRHSPRSIYTGSSWHSPVPAALRQLQQPPAPTRSPAPTSDPSSCPHQPNDGKDKNILYAELLHVSGAQLPQKSPVGEQTEYAVIKAAPAASR